MEQIWNGWAKTPDIWRQDRAFKSLRSKDGLMLQSAHNPEVVGSNPTPATMGA